MLEMIHPSPEAHDTPADWDQVFTRVEQLGVPEDEHERAEDVARHFIDGVDIEMFGKALHDVLVPDVESMPVNHTMKLYSLVTGEETRSFAKPEERAAVYARAGDAIKQLAVMRQSPNDDADFLMRAANIIALSIGQAHSYENGNGRTARFIAELLYAGTKNKDDLMILGGARERTARERGMTIPSFVQRYESVDAGETDADVIAAAASLDIPLSDRQTYEARANTVFSTPIGY